MSVDVSGRTSSDAPASRGSPMRVRLRALPDWVFISGVFFVVLFAAVSSIATQPATLAAAAWWPVAGIALGLGIRYPRRYAWVLSLGVAAMVLPVSLWAGRPPVLATVLVALTATEMVLGVLMLRGRRDKLPALTDMRDLVRLLGVILITATFYTLAASAVSFLLGDLDGAWARLVTALPKHAAGMVLITPLFMALPVRPRRAGLAESAAQILTVVAVAVWVFTLNSLPLAFLVFVPLVWAAVRMSTRVLLIEMLCIAVIASLGSSHGAGPFSFERHGAATGTVALQVFQISMAVVFLALSLAVGVERETAARLHASEELFRKSFNSSVAGKLMVTRGAAGWTVQRYNPSARDLLPDLGNGVVRLEALVGEDASAALSNAADASVEPNVRLTVALRDGRSMEVSMAAITEQSDGTLFTLHFHDVTTELRLQQLEHDELQLAADMQRALLPERLPETPGWMCGTVSTPARHVGGDFYDLRLEASFMAVSLGDVMGKGVGAGMLASATRTALRFSNPGVSPSILVERAAHVLDTDLERANAFITLAHVLVDLDCGAFRVTDAGHGLCFVIRGGGRGVERLASSDPPVGLGESWHEVAGVLDAGDSLLLVSDGVLDLWGGSLRDFQNAIACNATRHERDPQSFVESLCCLVNESFEQDDLTAVALLRER